VVYGFLRTADAVSPVPGLVVPFVTFTLLYIFLAVVVAVLLRQQVRLGERGPAPEVTHGA
jgi:cytochrome d ubiquinol oxidase subunit I